MIKLVLCAAMLSLSLLANTPTAYARQTDTPAKEPWSYGTNVYYGAYFRYRAGLAPVNYTHPFGVEMYAHRHTLGKRAWERKYRLPQIGFALTYFNYGVPHELGVAYTLTSYLDHILLPVGKGQLRFNVGGGLVYSTHYYIPERNEMNTAIGSPIAISMRANLRYEYPITQKLLLNAQLAFRHFSNGGLNQSNNGMNMPLLALGLRYQPTELKIQNLIDTVQFALDKKVRVNMRASIGFKEVLAIDTKHPVYSVSLYGSKRLTQTNGLYLGVDAWKDTAIRQEFINRGYLDPEREMDGRMVGIMLGHELYIGDLAVITQMGRYLRQPHGLFPDYYQKYGLRYFINKHVSVSGQIIAHGGHANVIEWGLGLHL